MAWSIGNAYNSPLGSISYPGLSGAGNFSSFWNSDSGSSSGTGIAGKFWDSLGTGLEKSIPSIFQSLLNPQPNYQKMMTDAAVIPQAMTTISANLAQKNQVPLAEVGAALQQLYNVKGAVAQRDIYSPISRDISLQDLEFSRDQNASERAERYQGDPTLNFKSPASLESDPSVFSTAKFAANPFFNRLANKA